MDREVREPLDLIDEIERTLGMSTIPLPACRHGAQLRGGMRPAKQLYALNSSPDRTVSTMKKKYSRI